MTLTIHTLNEWKRAELNGPRLLIPVPLEELEKYMQEIKTAAGPHPAVWDPDCEALAAMDVLQDIFKIRRQKLTRAAEMNPDDATTPMPKQLYPFENCAWFGLTGNFRLLDQEIELVCVNGNWSGTWGPKKK